MPYSWGDDTGSYASSYGGYSYDEARKAYSEPGKPKTKLKTTKTKVFDDDERVYSRDFKWKDITKPPVEKEIKSDSAHPIVVMVDVTGSMSSWPEVIFAKLPLLGKEVKRIFDDYEIAFAAVGDTRCDEHPLQMRDFGKEEALDEHIAHLYPEGGGGDSQESYAVAAYYYLHHCTIDKATKPICILVCDAEPHDTVRPGEVKKYIGDTLQEELDSKIVLKELADKFSMYVIYRGRIWEHNYWRNLLGEDRVISLQDSSDIVEAIIGIIAIEAGREEEFVTRMIDRHEDKPERVTRMMKSLRLTSGDKKTKVFDAVKSKTVKKTKSTKSKKLI